MNIASGLVGEQSNAYRILLRYDRKSRHRRIKKQRRYERLAATSQFFIPPPSPAGIARTKDHDSGPASYRAFKCWGRKPPVTSGLTLEGTWAYPLLSFPEPDATPAQRPTWRKPIQGIGSLVIRDNFIPVVTFLAPLASNFEGLKDR